VKSKRPQNNAGKSRAAMDKNRHAGQLRRGARSNIPHRDEKSVSGASGPSAGRPSRRPASTNRLPERTGILLKNQPDTDYALLDTGDGQKLERYGTLTIIRPEAQAMWQKSMTSQAWSNADAIFTGDTDEEGLGRWQFPKHQLGETFAMHWDGMAYFGRFTSFRHTGVFPEQAAHWRFMMEQISTALEAGRDQPRILNLFGYTGIASLVAARAGAHVTHVDASKKAIGWARENQELAGLDDRPIRWICEDAAKFCEREVRRGNRYDGILLDPPAYGRGPKGEVWQMFDDLPYMVDLCRELTSEKPLFTVLTAYTIRASFLAIHELMQEVYGDAGGLLESGELAIQQQNSGRCLSTSMFSRWIANPDTAKEPVG